MAPMKPPEGSGGSEAYGGYRRLKHKVCIRAFYIRVFYIRVVYIRVFYRVCIRAFYIRVSYIREFYILSKGVEYLRLYEHALHRLLVLRVEVQGLEASEHLEHSTARGYARVKAMYIFQDFRA